MPFAGTSLAAQGLLDSPIGDKPILMWADVGVGLSVVRLKEGHDVVPHLGENAVSHTVVRDDLHWKLGLCQKRPDALPACRHHFLAQEASDQGPLRIVPGVSVGERIVAVEVAHVQVLRYALVCSKVERRPDNGFEIPDTDGVRQRSCSQRRERQDRKCVDAARCHGANWVRVECRKPVDEGPGGGEPVQKDPPVHSNAVPLALPPDGRALDRAAKTPARAGVLRRPRSRPGAAHVRREPRLRETATPSRAPRAATSGPSTVESYRSRAPLLPREPRKRGPAQGRRELRQWMSMLPEPVRRVISAPPPRTRPWSRPAASRARRPDGRCGRRRSGCAHRARTRPRPTGRPRCRQTRS